MTWDYTDEPPQPLNPDEQEATEADYWDRLYDLQKAAWYIQREITRLQAQDDASSTVELVSSTAPGAPGNFPPPPASPGDYSSPWVDGDESSAFPTSDTLKTLDELDNLFKKLHETPTEDVGHAMIYEVTDRLAAASDLWYFLSNPDCPAVDATGDVRLTGHPVYGPPINNKVIIEPCNEPEDDDDDFIITAARGDVIYPSDIINVVISTEDLENLVCGAFQLLAAKKAGRK